MGGRSRGAWRTEGIRRAMLKYLALFGLILGFFIFVFVQDQSSRPMELTPGQERYRSIIEHVSMLERRRMELFRASGRSGVFSGPGRAMIRPGRAGSYGRGYALGFSQGYRIGEYLSSSRTANPLFYPIPSPY